MLHVLNLCITHQIEKNVWWINYRSRYLARLSKGWLYQLKKNICDIHVKEKSQLFFIQYTLTCQASSILYVYTVHPQYGLSSPWKKIILRKLQYMYKISYMNLLVVHFYSSFMRTILSWVWKNTDITWNVMVFQCYIIFLLIYCNYHMYILPQILNG